MPIDIEYLRKHEEAATRFVQSQDGLILNIVARAVAASRSKIHGGHLIIHKDSGNPTGAFVLSPNYIKGFEGTADQNFSRVSGLLAELFFCNAPSVKRSLADLGTVVRTNHPFNPNDREQNEAIQFVRQTYEHDFSRIFSAVHSNYYLVQHAITVGNFLIGNYHVIPSYILATCCRSTFYDKIVQYVSTSSFNKRTKALEHLLKDSQIILPSILS